MLLLQHMKEQSVKLVAGFVFYSFLISVKHSMHVGQYVFRLVASWALG